MRRVSINFFMHRNERRAKRSDFMHSNRFAPHLLEALEFLEGLKMFVVRSWEDVDIRIRTVLAFKS